MIPNGWSATQIGDIARFTSGGTPSKQNASFWGGAEPWISGKDLKSHYISNSIDTLTKEGFRVANTAPAGCTLILVRGMTLLKDFPVGYAVRDVAFNQDLKALHPYECIDGLFLSFLLVGEKHKIRQLVSTAGHGTGRLDTESIQSYPVNIPPLPEQQKIAKILSTWDKAISTTAQLLANSQQQKKALMQQLLTGQRRLLDDDGLRFSGEWVETKISKTGKVVSGGTPDTDNKDFWDGNINWITPTDVTALVNRFVYKTARTITTLGVANSSATILPKGSLLICTRATIGAMAISTSEICTNQGFKSIIPNKSFDVEFLYYILKKNVKLLIRKASGSTFLEISKKDFESIELSMPSLTEQQKIAAVLSAADQEISTLQQQLATLKQEKKALMQQLLTGKVRVKLTAPVGAN